MSRITPINPVIWLYSPSLPVSHKSTTREWRVGVSGRMNHPIRQRSVVRPAYIHPLQLIARAVHRNLNVTVGHAGVIILSTMISEKTREVDVHEATVATYVVQDIQKGAPCPRTTHPIVSKFGVRGSLRIFSVGEGWGLGDLHAETRTASNSGCEDRPRHHPH